MEPVDPSKHPIRLFAKKATAAAFLTTWVKGHQVEHRRPSLHGYESDGIEIIKGTERNRYDYAVVPVVLEWVSEGQK